MKVCSFAFSAAALAIAGFAAVPASAAPVRVGMPVLPGGMPGSRTLAETAVRGNFVGSVNRGEIIDVYIRLQGQHENEIARLIDAQQTPGSPWYSRFLTPEQYGRYFGAPPAAYVQAIALLRARGFVIDSLAPNRTDIVAHAPAATVSAFFETPLDLRSENGRIFRTNRFEPVFPAALHAVAVSGLETYHHKHSMLRRQPQSIASGAFGWGPPDLAAAYDLNPLYKAGHGGQGVTIANATAGQARASDLALFQQHFNLPKAQLATVVVPNGPANYGGIGESTLDVDSALGIARNATFLQVLAKGATDHNFDLSYQYIVNDANVHVATTSWGECERDIKGTQSLTIDEKLFAQAATEGQAWFAAAGDNGTDDCEDYNSKFGVSVDYPGSSPNVVSVGGTNLQGNRNGSIVTSWNGETTWQYSNSDGATGGGKSILFDKPSWQKGRTPNDGVRDVPDVALIADNNNSPLIVAINGGIENGWGGTSESAPMWAGFLAIVIEMHGNKPVANPHNRLYALASSGSYHSLFHDITSGNNGVPASARDPYGPHTFPGYNATPNFDLTTGWGSFIGYALANAY